MPTTITVMVVMSRVMRMMSRGGALAALAAHTGEAARERLIQMARTSYCRPH